MAIDWTHAGLNLGAREAEGRWGHAAAPALRSTGEIRPREKVA